MELCVQLLQVISGMTMLQHLLFVLILKARMMLGSLVFPREQAQEKQRALVANGMIGNRIGRELVEIIFPLLRSTQIHLEVSLYLRQDQD